jgi:hypothetical protein
MSKPASIVLATVGALSFLASSIRPRLVGEGVRFARWHHLSR